jgi:hypothetical protein
MQELKTKIVKLFSKKYAGSALVGVIALSAVMAIACLGYLQVSTTSSNFELESLRDDKAFTAAEAGLMVGAGWLQRQSVAPSKTLPGVITLNENGIDVSVTIVFLGQGLVELHSTASTSRLPYDKLLTWQMGVESPGNYGTFLNGLFGNNHRAQGGFMNTVFDGPFHSNEAMMISAAGGAVISKFLEKTTVHHTAADHWDYGDGFHDNNNYDYGVEVAGHDAMWLDKNVFMEQFRHHQSKIVLPPVKGQDILLPASDPVVNPNSEIPEKRALLRFNGSQATYYYWAGGNLKTLNINAVDQKVIRAKNEINVIGKITGKTTVVTDKGYNIYPVGDITYTDFSPDAEANYVGPNQLALVSGNDVFFKAKWMEPKTQAILDVKGAGDGMYVTASLIATEAGSTHRLIQGKNKLVKANAYHHSLHKKGFRIIGSRAIDHWFQVNTGAAEFLTVHYDQRLRKGSKAPGIPAFQRVNDDGTIGLALLPGTWQEKNVPH